MATRPERPETSQEEALPVSQLSQTSQEEAQPESQLSQTSQEEAQPESQLSPGKKVKFSLYIM